MKFLPFIWSNLGRRKLRTSLTVLSILVAFLLYGYLAAIQQALVGGVSMAGADRIVVRHKVSITQMLPETYKERIRNVPGVAAVTHSSWFGGVYQEPRNFFAQMPVEPEAFLDMYPEYQLTEEERQAWFSKRTGAIAGRPLAEKFGWKVGDRIPIQATVWVQESGQRLWEFDLAGIYDIEGKSGDPNQFFFRYDYFEEARAFAKGQVGWYIVRVYDPDQAVAVAEGIDREFANSTAETKAETEGAFVQGFANQIGNIGAIMVGILTAVFFTILLVAGNTMAQSVRERTEEIGVLKSMGFTHGHVLGFVLGESCFMAMLGGFAGLGIAWLLISRGDPTGGALPMFYLPPGDVAMGAVYVLLLGLISGALPAIQAMRLQVAEALRRM